MGMRVPHSIQVHDLLAIAIEIIFKKVTVALNCVSFQIDHGPEWDVESLIPIPAPYRHFSNFWVLKTNDFAKRNFLIQVNL